LREKSRQISDQGRKWCVGDGVETGEGIQLENGGKKKRGADERGGPPAGWERRKKKKPAKGKKLVFS